MMTSDFMPVRSGNCSMNFGLSPVRMPARPDCIAAAAPDVTIVPYPSGSLSISAMRLPAATSSSGMLTKWRPAIAITASTSGRIREPPSTVMVPCPLITAVTPNSSYTFPVAPKPERGAALLPAARGRAKTLRPLNKVPTNAPRVPRKVLRFQLSLNVIDLCLILCVAHNGSDTVDFNVADRDSQDGGSNLAQGTFQALGGFLQLPLESVDLLGYIIKLFLSQRSRSRNFLNSAIRFAHGGPNFHRNTSEPALSCHRWPPLRTESSYTRTIPRAINQTGWASQSHSSGLSSHRRISLERAPTHCNFI